MNPSGAGDPVARRPLGWLMWLSFAGAVGWAVTAMLVPDRRGTMLWFAGGFLAAGIVVGLVGGAMTRRTAGTPTSGVVATAEPAEQPMPGTLGRFASWGMRSAGGLAKLPTRMLRIFGIFFVIDAAILIGMAIAFPVARSALIFGAIVMIAVGIGFFFLFRWVGRLMTGVTQGMGDLGGVGDLIEQMTGGLIGGDEPARPAGPQPDRLDVGGGASVDLHAPDGIDPATKARLKTAGVDATGTIEEVTDTGVLLGTSHVLAVTMSVAIPGRQPVTSRTAAIVPEVTRGRLVKGATVPVRIDPSDPRVISAEWSRA